MVQELRNVRREVLPNGLTILTEEMQQIRSTSIGIWIRTGSRNEEAERNGISHFVEHMLFKGTTSRSAQDIARQVDSIGDRKSTRLNSSHLVISYAVFCLKKKKTHNHKQES